MREKSLAVDCPAREPDPVLLEQLTALAAASTVPAERPWWHRFTVKTGAAAVAGVLLISGATADAEHGRARQAPIAATVVVSTPRAAPHRTLVHVAKPQTSVELSPVIFPRISGPIRHAWKRSQHLRKHEHALGQKHEKGKKNGGGSQDGQVGARLARLAAPALSAAPRFSDGKSHEHQHGLGHTQH